MSDDEMDIDEVQTSEKVVFSSKEFEKGKKRIAADLPVTIGDNLPWVEKYRPNTLDDVTGHEDIITTIHKFVDTNRLPHLLFYGPPGTGKTSTILALARKIYGPTRIRQQVLELNASDDRGIEVVREQIKTFASTKQIFNTIAPAGSANSSLASFKLIILDEADAMTSTAQNALRRIMEKYTSNTRFCIIANYTHKLNPAVLSRCTRFRFSPLPPMALRKRIDHVVAQEGVKITPEAIDALVTLSKGDMRRSLNVLQACFASSTPLDEKGFSIPDGPKDTITEEAIYECIAAPQPSDIQTILASLLGEDISTAVRTMEQVRQMKGLALVDVLGEISVELGKLEVAPEVRVKWLEGLAEIEWRLGSGGAERIQAGAVVGVVRSGVELMERKQQPRSK
ncbi:replication factor C protein subunit 3 [Terfezia boudieri ATCC MYA-4762]|uniref:Replication factor C subunit 3 n=1 Tax=Terfezia boudieri ATCC MYA-4762 TaxID=1051890 RepID=A0A3N4LSR2_9PEZI|nr:replication factor C protein subunit 3 [Terfezia boudieri ATCC MYA-4762]